MAGRLEVGLLGCVEVRESGDVVPIAGAKLKAIIALLALGSPHPVSAERLIDEVWEDGLPGNPTNSLHAQLSTIRRLLGRDAIERRGQGYLLAVGPDDIDAIRLERLVRPVGSATLLMTRAPRSSTSRSAQPRCAVPPSATSASSASHGRPPYASASSSLSAHEGLVDGRLAIGEHAAVVAEITALVQDHPLHERFHAQLVLALYRCGRQADALQAYQQARRVLRDELGVEPCPELRALEVAILNQDPALDAPTVAAAERAPIEGSAPSARDGPATRFPLVGRADDVSALRADLASANAGRGRVALVAGEPGIGKTRLVEEIANEAVGAGGIVAWGAVLRGSWRPGFWPWVQIIGDLLDLFDRAVVVDALERRPETWRRSSPRSRSSSPIPNRHRPTTRSPPASGSVRRSRSSFVAWHGTSHSFSCSTTCTGPTRPPSTSSPSSPTPSMTSRSSHSATFRSLDPRSAIPWLMPSSS